MRASWRYGLLTAVLLAAALGGGSFAQEEPQPPPRKAFKGLPDAPKPTAKYPGNDLAGIGEHDARTKVAVSDPPWRGVGRLDSHAGHCTAALIGPDLLLTAAHCVFDPSTRRILNISKRDGGWQVMQIYGPPN